MQQIQKKTERYIQINILYTCVWSGKKNKKWKKKMFVCEKYCKSFANLFWMQWIIAAWWWSL